MATAEDSPLAMKLKKTWLRTPVGEEQAAQAVLDPSIGIKHENYILNLHFILQNTKIIVTISLVSVVTYSILFHLFKAIGFCFQSRTIK